ncbi:SPAG4 protein, partial [Rhinopomastus cyanomelas]|nr:SPAG4 protein [Rhinopomastus cyanomelas]
LGIFTALALCLQPDAFHGYCWPFQGSRSELLIQLPAQVIPTDITLQRMPEEIATLDSAPQDFAVLGLDEAGEVRPVLGIFRQTTWKEPTQRFSLQVEAFSTLKLIVWNSRGNLGYTCIYSVQVHGK